MSTTSCVRHRENTRFFIKYEDILQLCKGDQAKAAAHRVLEVKTNNQLIYLNVLGRKLEEITEEDLWFTMHWEDFAFWSLGDREKSSFRRVLPEIQKDGYVKSRYVKEDEHNQVLRDRTGRVYTYSSYKAAAADHQVDGLIVLQYLYLYAKVNEALDKLGPAPLLPGKGDDATGDGRAEGVTSKATTSPVAQSTGSARGGNLQGASASVYDSITPLPKTTGGNTGLLEMGEIPCPNEQDPPAQMDMTPVQTNNTPPAHLDNPPVQNDRNLRITGESSVQESSNDRTTVAPGSGTVVLSVDGEKENETTDDPEEVWSVPAILNLAAQYLEALPTGIRVEQQKMNETQWYEAAQAIHQASYFHFIGPDGAIAALDEMLDFVTNPESPSWWVQVFSSIQHKPVRLWHIARNAQAISQDMIKFGWPREDSQASEPDTDPEPVMTPELVEVTQASGEPRGMTEDAADALLSEIARSHAGLYPRRERVRGRLGYKIVLETSPGRSTVLYSAEEWQEWLIARAAAPKPSERFRALLEQRKAG